MVLIWQRKFLAEVLTVSNPVFQQLIDPSASQLHIPACNIKGECLSKVSGLLISHIVEFVENGMFMHRKQPKQITLQSWHASAY